MTSALVVLAVLAAGLAIWGWRHGGTELAYFAAERSAGPVLAGLGGTAAGLSAFVFVGGPGLFATLGAASLWIILSAPLTGALQCWVVGEPVVSMARRHACLTVPDLIDARFGGGWPRGLAAAAIAVGGVAVLAVQVKGLAVVGETLLGLPGPAVAAATVAATVAYTAAGGMRAGLLAEAAQGALMAVVSVALAVAALAAAGGPTAAIATLVARRPELLDPWHGIGATGAIAWFLLFALGTCAQPHYLQKFLLLRSAASLRRLPLVMTGALVAVLTVWVGIGLGAGALWADGHLALSGPDDLAPAFLARTAPWLLVAAVVAVLAAVMSTAASLLNVVAAALVRDLPMALGRRPPKSLAPARLATLAVAAAGGACAVASARQVAILGIVGWGTFTAALFPTVALGLNWPGATRHGAAAALVAGPATQLLLEVLHHAERLTPAWEPGLAGTAVGVLVLIVVSSLTSRRTA